MSLRDNLGELWRELRGQKLRALLTLGAVAWGTLSLVLLLAFSFGFEELFANRQRALGDGIAIAWPQRTTLSWQGFPRGRTLSLRHADVRALPDAVPELEAISAEFTITERVRTGAAVHRVPLSGVDESFARLRQLVPQPGGRWLSATDSAQRRRVIFLGDALARRLFGAVDPVGRTLVLRAAAFLVIGVMVGKDQDSDYGGLDRDRAWIPATTYGAVFTDPFVDDVVFRARDPRRQAECTAAVVAALARRLRFDPSDTEALSVWDTTEQQRMMFFIFLAFHTMLGVGGGFTALVGGLGVAHLMHLLVRRRTGEIGLKMALGARPTTIRREWLLQAAALVGSGAGGGVLLAVALIAVLRATPITAQVGEPFLPPLLAAAVAGLLALIGFVAGWLPARAASRLDPVLALRSAP
ncbi:MAG: ABC transporter permease [Planctomycetes bacterium]|nr:ABC transporter permease [Planctomycetota bacterium]